jgi:hypothetical protein
MGLYDSSLKGLCEKTLANFEEYVGINNPRTMAQKNGILTALRSDTNLAGAQQMTTEPDNDGKFRAIRVKYMQRDSDSTNVTDPDNYDCDTGTEDQWKEASVPTSDFSYEGTKEMKLSRNYLRQICDDDAVFGEFFQTVVLKSMNAVRTGIGKKVLTSIATGCVGVNLGNEVSGVPSASAKSIQILKSDGAADHYGLAQVGVDMSENEVDGVHSIVGQGNWQLFHHMAGMSCCNDSGIDGAMSNDWYSQNYRYHLDQNANSILGTNNALVIAPGAVQLLTFCENQGNGFVDYNGNYAHITLPDPVVPGLMYDWELKYSPCKKYFITHFGAWYYTWCWPSDVFSASDRLNGMTGVFLYTGTKGS